MSKYPGIAYGNLLDYATSITALDGSSQSAEDTNYPLENLYDRKSNLPARFLVKEDLVLTIDFTGSAGPPFVAGVDIDIMACFALIGHNLTADADISVRYISQFDETLSLFDIAVPNLNGLALPNLSVWSHYDWTGDDPPGRYVKKVEITIDDPTNSQLPCIGELILQNNSRAEQLSFGYMYGFRSPKGYTTIINRSEFGNVHAYERARRRSFEASFQHITQAQTQLLETYYRLARGGSDMILFAPEVTLAVLEDEPTQANPADCIYGRFDGDFEATSLAYNNWSVPINIIEDGCNYAYITA
jgi:hypothetical protein